MKKSYPGEILACKSGMNPYPLPQMLRLHPKNGDLRYLVETGVK
jgi:hypothetical protein